MNGLITTRWQLLPAALALCAGCLVDTDSPCRENEVELDGKIRGCTCVTGAVPTADGSACVMCGAYEVVKGGKCECDVGFARPDAAGACVRSELGATCSPSAACGADFPFCAAGGYCTKQGCTTGADCAGGYWCDTTMTPSVCTRPPSGLGKTCTTSPDCAGQEANTCAMGSCVVGGCATGAAKCYADTVCCDFTSFGIGDICIPPTSLMGGKCPVTGMDPVVQR